MTKTFYEKNRKITKIYTSPKIYNYDFDSYTSMCTIADRIMADIKIDLQYKKINERKIKGE